MPPRSMRRPMSRKMSELATKAAYSHTVPMVTRVTGLMLRRWPTLPTTMPAATQATTPDMPRRCASRNEP